MVLPPIDPAHWLFRLSPEGWLKAARNELAAGEQAIVATEQRRTVVYARRAAGMAFNAVLVVRPNEAWGRSYMDHIRAVVSDEGLSDEIRAAAHVLVDAPTAAPKFVRIGGGADVGPAAAAGRIIAWCEAEVGGASET
jgi:hypothetical protein